eukprot:SAG31_NODE_39235_length_290_cov_0.303665_1_plen_40_part_10
MEYISMLGLLRVHCLPFVSTLTMATRLYDLEVPEICRGRT